MINTKLEINGVEYTNHDRITIRKSSEKNNSTSSFTISFDNVVGRYKDKFNLNEEVVIYSDKDVAATTKILTGIIENIKFNGKGEKETLVLTGRDYGAVLQDIIVNPRIFKDTETSEIVSSVMSQNVSQSLITTNNVNVTTTTIEKITLNNLSVFDALRQLAELSGFYFYVDEDKDLHFEQIDSVSSGETFDNTNVLSGKFTSDDRTIFNKVTVYGDRQLTRAREVFTTGTDNTGSIYNLTDKPHNTSVTLSGAVNTLLQPGGVININDPSAEDVKYLVEFDEKNIILTSGTSSGDNIQPTGSVVIVDYDRSTPIVKIKLDNSSSSKFGPKHKVIINRNIKSFTEANEKATAFLDENKNEKIQGDLEIDGVLAITPGNTAVVNLPFHNQVNQTYAIIGANYDFLPSKLQKDKVLSVRMNKRIPNFFDIMKEQVLRMRALEASQIDTSIINVEFSTGSVGVSGTTSVIQRSIGSGFFFHVLNHNLFESPTSLLGDMRGGSIVFQDGVKI